MHNLDTFISLFREEAKLTPAFNAASTLDAIRADFSTIVKTAGFRLADIDVAYVAGSYARGQQTIHSDIDIECYASTILQEYQSTFMWRGHLVSFSVYPAGSVRGEPDNLIDRSWARSCYRTAQPVYDPHGTFDALVAAYAGNEPVTESAIPNSLWKTLRKVIEYQRKLLSAIDSGDTLMQNFAASRLLESYVVARTILSQAEITSEKGQFDVLSQLKDEHGQSFRRHAERLFTPLTIAECRSVTQHFLNDLARVLEGVQSVTSAKASAPKPKRH